MYTSQYGRSPPNFFGRRYKTEENTVGKKKKRGKRNVRNKFCEKAEE
jgi:hypothetical protein